MDSEVMRAAVADHPFVIAKAGKPLVQVTAIPAPQPADRLGFMAGQIAVPDDFDTLGRDDIQALFGPQAEAEGFALLTADLDPGPRPAGRDSGCRRCRSGSRRGQCGVAASHGHS